MTLSTYPCFDRSQGAQVNIIRIIVEMIDSQKNVVKDK